VKGFATAGQTSLLEDEVTRYGNESIVPGLVGRAMGHGNESIVPGLVGRVMGHGVDSQTGELPPDWVMGSTIVAHRPLRPHQLQGWAKSS
jgi:hypothetical protein